MSVRSTRRLAATLAAPCNPTGPLKVSVDVDRAVADTIVSAHLCLTVPASGAKVASLGGRLRVDTSFARILDITRPTGSPFLANADGAGSVLVAGAVNRRRNVVITPAHRSGALTEHAARAVGVREKRRTRWTRDVHDASERCVHSQAG